MTTARSHPTIGLLLALTSVGHAQQDPPYTTYTDFSQVLKMTVYVADIELWAPVNEVYARVLGEHRPARAVIPTGKLHYGFLIEIDAIAAAYE